MKTCTAMSIQLVNSINHDKDADFVKGAGICRREL